MTFEEELKKVFELCLGEPATSLTLSRLETDVKYCLLKHFGEILNVSEIKSLNVKGAEKELYVLTSSVSVKADIDDRTGSISVYFERID